MTLRQRQHGVALVTAILMVAIATALATKMSWDNQLNMRRTESALNMEQARELAVGAETVAISIIDEQGQSFGNFLQDIAEPIVFDAGIEDIALGTIQGQLFDMEGRLNINNLVIGGAAQTPVREQFLRLFNILASDYPNLNFNPALLDTIIDWIDPDTVPYGAGAEDDAYTALEPAYRTANNYLLDISELRAVGGVTPEIYAALLPHVIAIPPGWCGNAGTSRVNLNFATPQVMVAVTDVAPGVAEQMVAERDEQPWQELQDVSLPADLLTAAEPYISVTTNCFALSVNVNVGSSTLTMYSLIDRAATAGGIVARVRAYGLEN